MISTFNKNKHLFIIHVGIHKINWVLMGWLRIHHRVVAMDMVGHHHWVERLWHHGPFKYCLITLPYSELVVIEI